MTPDELPEKSPADKSLEKLKFWFLAALASLVLTLLGGLIAKYTGEKIVVPPPPLSVFIQPGPDKNDPFTGAKAVVVPVATETTP